MKTKLIAAVASLGLLLASPAFAQQKTGPNGGMVAGKDGHETELIVSASELTVYILEEGKVHSTKGTKVKAVVQQDGKVTPVELKDADGKKLVGTLAAPLAKGAIVVLTGKDGHGHSISSRYVIN
jgi:ABC-type transport system involved in cytochrome bd biosynthesis fused ATPase/permease subunit